MLLLLPGAAANAAVLLCACGLRQSAGDSDAKPQLWRGPHARIPSARASLRHSMPVRDVPSACELTRQRCACGVKPCVTPDTPRAHACSQQTRWSGRSDVPLAPAGSLIKLSTWTRFCSFAGTRSADGCVFVQTRPVQASNDAVPIGVVVDAQSTTRIHNTALRTRTCRGTARRCAEDVCNSAASLVSAPARKLCRALFPRGRTRYQSISLARELCFDYLRTCMMHARSWSVTC